MVDTGPFLTPSTSTSAPRRTKRLKSVGALETIKSYHGQDDTCLQKVQTTMTIPLSPSCIGRELERASEQLNKWKYNYFNELNGFLMGHEDLKIQGDSAEIRGCFPFVLYKFSGTFYMFKPDESCLVKGKIFRVSTNRKERILNCYIMESISAVVKIPDDLPSKLEGQLFLGGDIVFRIVDVTYENCAVYGVLDEASVQLMSSEMEGEGVEEEDSGHEGGRKKKKKLMQETGSETYS